jgi:hypothetical protein
MSHVWVDIESLVLDGVRLDPAKGRWLAALTQMAVERLLREHGISVGAGLVAETHRKTQGADMKSQPGADERRWAGELAEVLYRTIDRTV